MDIRSVGGMSSVRMIASLMALVLLQGSAAPEADINVDFGERLAGWPVPQNGASSNERPRRP